MGDLHKEHCEACRADAPMVSDEELAELIMQIPDWQPITIDGILQLQREYLFSNYVEAQAFTNQVADLAEQWLAEKSS